MPYPTSSSPNDRVAVASLSDWSPLLFIPGLLFLIFGLAWNKPWQATNWHKAPGKIAAFGGDGPYKTKSGNQYIVAVIYSYTVAGVSYPGDTLNLSPSQTVDAGTYQDLKRNYPPGRAVTVYYDVNDVSESVLDPDDGKGTYLIIAGSILCLTGVVIAVISRSNRLHVGTK